MTSNIGGCKTIPYKYPDKYMYKLRTYCAIVNTFDVPGYEIISKNTPAICLDNITDLESGEIVSDYSWFAITKEMHRCCLQVGDLITFKATIVDVPRRNYTLYRYEKPRNFKTIRFNELLEPILI